MRPLAAPHHPAWERCPARVRDLHARNVPVVLGIDMRQPVHAMLCWSNVAGNITGRGTGRTPAAPGWRSASRGITGSRCSTSPRSTHARRCAGLTASPLPSFRRPTAGRTGASTSDPAERSGRSRTRATGIGGEGPATGFRPPRRFALRADGAPCVPRRSVRAGAAKQGPDPDMRGPRIPGRLRRRHGRRTTSGQSTPAFVRIASAAQSTMMRP